MIDINLLKDLYKINSKSGEEEQIREFIINFVSENYPSVEIETDSYGNVYFTKGKAKDYPTVVGHLDQVGTYKGKIGIYRKNNIIVGFGETGQQVNLGADDKNGIWIALQLLRSEPILKVCFFVEEEIGCQGSANCDMTFFYDSRFVIQCDRKNSGDFINYASYVQLCDTTFVSKELLDKYGYSYTTGLMTDVQELKKRGLSVACCNLSCGYYNPHTDNEYTDIEELINCLNFCKEIIRITPLTKHTFTYAKASVYNSVDEDYDDYEDPEYRWYAQYYKKLYGNL